MSNYQAVYDAVFKQFDISWQIARASEIMNLVEEQALRPSECRFDVALIIRRRAPAYYYATPEDQIEVVVEIDVWHRGQFHGIDATTYEAAFAKFHAVILPALNLDNPESAAERLAAMDATSEQVASFQPIPEEAL